ncbi:hypothetical protein GOV12_02080 [Candidatus Pacearchaeota archaeon]|nr:hypothetical protein [Candidatus Pacearchaeota archaeon]
MQEKLSAIKLEAYQCPHQTCGMVLLKNPDESPEQHLTRAQEHADIRFYNPFPRGLVLLHHTHQELPDSDIYAIITGKNDILSINDPHKRFHTYSQENVIFMKPFDFSRPLFQTYNSRVIADNIANQTNVSFLTNDQFQEFSQYFEKFRKKTQKEHHLLMGSFNLEEITLQRTSSEVEALIQNAMELQPV